MLFKYHYQYNYGGDSGGNRPISTIVTSLSEVLLLRVGLRPTVWASLGLTELESIFSQSLWIIHVHFKG